METRQDDQNKTNKKHWRCINCGATTTTDWSATPGGKCPKEFGNGNHNWELQSETNESGHPIDRYQAQCPECGSIFYSREAFQEHVRVEHGTGPLYECPHCGRRFSRMQDLKDHKEICLER